MKRIIVSRHAAAVECESCVQTEQPTARALSVYDRSNGYPVAMSLLRELDASPVHAASLWSVDPDDDLCPISVVVYHATGMVFSPADWHGPQPQTIEDIPQWVWIDGQGREAIMLDGWPTTIR
jgi:hypothetical protein